MLSLCCLIGVLQDDLMSRMFAKGIAEAAGNSIKGLQRNCEADRTIFLAKLIFSVTKNTHLAIHTCLLDKADKLNVL